MTKTHWSVIVKQAKFNIESTTMYDCVREYIQLTVTSNVYFRCCDMQQNNIISFAVLFGILYFLYLCWLLLFLRLQRNKNLEYNSEYRHSVIYDTI